MTHHIVEQGSQAYAGVTRTVTMSTIGEIADAIPQIIGWLTERGVPVAGAPFLRYLVIDMAGRLRVEAGVPVASPVDGDTDVHAGTLPAGRYATVSHRGHPDGLVAVTESLLAWASDTGLTFDVTPGEDGEHWGCRLERFLTNPVEVPNMADWETEVAIKLADQ